MDLKELRENIVGLNTLFETPYGERMMTYADYTASGRSLKFIEKYMLEIQKIYANSHTDDDCTGKTMTGLLHKSEEIIKKELNASKNCMIIATGNGSTGAIAKFSEILGIYMPPATKVKLEQLVDNFLDMEENFEYRDAFDQLNDKWLKSRPVIFIGPYEHHSNILIWRESIAEVVEIKLGSDGYLDIDDLKYNLHREEYKNRIKIGSFSAASNVTGIKTEVYEISRILHENGALACFDFAASGPYVEINMNLNDESYFDAVFISPHKFIGGPGTTGLLVMNEKHYNNALPPTVAAGGTVNYVNRFSQDYNEVPEEREKAGTPGILQMIKAALVFELKGRVGADRIEEIEETYTRQFFERFKNNKNIEILGPLDAQKRISIISFMIKNKGKYLHPRFVTKLLNDLFGIQSRAGCACAGPYGHRLLSIDDETAKIMRSFLKEGMRSLKLGWTRVNFHYVMSQEEVAFILDAIEFISTYGYLFLNEYEVNLQSGEWRHINESEANSWVTDFGIDRSIKLQESKEPYQSVDRSKAYQKYLDESHKMAATILTNAERLPFRTMNGKYEEQRWFDFANEFR
jgi:selenocysteine lyase/cysteine desulfurase